MGLDNGISVMSNRRKVTVDMLPNEIMHVFDEDPGMDGVEIIYWRKNWGLRDAIVNYLIKNVSTNPYDYIIETPNQVFEIIKIIVSFMDETKWKKDGKSIWEYSEVKIGLQRDVINLAIIASFMSNNPDIYLIFYDSY